MFQIIINEQTPNLEEMTNPQKWISDNVNYLNEFLDFAKSEKYSVGLASNQVSFNKNRILDRFMAIYAEKNWFIAINPQIVSRSGNPSFCHEGCLTWPDKKIVAERYPHVDIDFWTIDGIKAHKCSKDHFESQIWQHEINHLNGVEELVVNKDDETIKRIMPKIGRNAPCPCGSGKKYKKCCL